VGVGGPARLLKQPIGRGLERALHHRADLRRQPAPQDDHAVVVHPGVEVAVQMSLRGLFGRHRAIDAAPGSCDALDLGCGCAQGQIHQARLVRRRRNAGDRAHLRIGQRPAPHGCSDERKVGQRVGDAYFLARRAQTEADPPVEPMGTGKGSRSIPALAGVEALNQDEELVCGGVHARGEFGDGVADLLGVARIGCACRVECRAGEALRRGT
jgi:hypothetical protein